ncbi:MAG: hypothetical protein O7G85_15965 [Planctomycetota bacterium]|nr:hypothetical protein [Planctomycetota bacterium]
MNDERAEQLISKVIDGQATDADWSELSAQAAQTPELWRDLAESQRHQQVLSLAINEAVSVVGKIEAPTDRIDSLVADEARNRRTSARAWSGWAVAAVVAIAAFFNQYGMRAQLGQMNSNPSVLSAGWSADEAFDAYLDQGRKEGKVVGEMPSKVIVSTRENPDGEGYEIICLQQIVIREIVPDLLEVTGETPEGQFKLVPYTPKPSGF